ncbi:histone-like nucleoid-structuring protein Lsr2 [Clavibacter sepedonicus]|uniref:LSR2-family protein n=1 Tax=Clavibacter sepedonicus TaxID=31964 RepID=B0RJ68_CLASE|nr:MULTISPECIES: Lsr2 family protein [Clavibacter]MBD5382558.1 Lsr2 family protein [Clavibacter sp.]OQJ45211.1 Lsr2 family protein [Clavibacter sepedonicus]OQJ50846.1 Lsr2 family protein [Clavibacter sepedonicus]UUK67357.1 Lsr2 family protein [Clavibacter sepedonicus]CAQ03258.1 LSR2-family protein [Clavibacter sepedonicus]
MARKVVTTLVDDIDGTEIVDGTGETVPFALDGVNYEIDLSDDNADTLRTVLKDYIDKGRRVGRATTGKPGTRRSSSSGPKGDLSAAREWLREHGHKVSERGRISADLLEEYRANN